MSDEENDGVNNDENNEEEENNEENNEEGENNEENENNEEEENNDGDEENAGGDEEGSEKMEEDEEKQETKENKKFEVLAPILESKIEIIGGKHNNSSVFNKSLFNYELFPKANKKKSVLSVLSEINKDLDSLENDLTKRRIINQPKPRSINPIARTKLNKYEDERSTISDMKFEDKKATLTKNKKLQVEIENYNKDYDKLSQKIESLNKRKDKGTGDRDTDREILKDLERVKKDREFKENAYESQNEKRGGNRLPYDEKRNQRENEKYYESSPQRSPYYNTAQVGKHNNYGQNNFQRTYTKNLDNNHYRTIEDLYKRSPKAPVYYSRENSKQKRYNNYADLNQVLTKRYPGDEAQQQQNQYNPNYKYESDYHRSKPKYNINNAMDILLDKNR